MATLAAFLFTLGLAPSAFAEQRSLDLKISEVYGAIDERSRTYETEAGQVRRRLGEMAVEIGELQGQLEDLPADLSEAESDIRRRELHARLTQLSALYLSEAYQLVDHATEVVAKNMVDLADLAQTVRASPDPARGANNLKAAIVANIASGKAMREVLLQIRTWAEHDRTVARRIASLRRTMASLDRRISLDKARLAGQLQDPTGTAAGHYMASIDRAVESLADMYAGLMAEKRALTELRDAVEVAIQLGVLDMTRVVAERAIPGLSSPQGPRTGVPGLMDVAGNIARLNRYILEDAAQDAVEPLDASDRPTALSIDEFDNF